MTYIPCRERTFPVWLAPRFEYHYGYYLGWLKHFLERLGRECTLAVWRAAFRDYSDPLLEQILSAAWEEVQDDADDVEGGIAGLPAEVFPTPVEGISSEEVRAIIEKTPPFRQIRQHLPSLNVMRQLTAYEALHLFRDGLARLAEAMIDQYGKQGEFIVYDAMLAEWPAGQQKMGVAEFMAARWERFNSEPEEPDIFTAGLEVELIRGSENEVVNRVKECEWARYFRERHPRVGYMLACSLDNAAYRSFNDHIRLQRTSTLMEGGEACDFRVYAVASAPDSDQQAG